MRLHVIPSPYYAANALVLVPAQGPAALVVDPSAGVQHLRREVLDLEGVRGGRRVDRRAAAARVPARP